MANIDLTQLDWQWIGWRPWTWQMRQSMETGATMRSDLGPFQAIVPGTIQSALLREGMLDDWHVGMNSLQCEWVEHRHWELVAKVPGEGLKDCRRVVLDAPWLDYSGWLLIDNGRVAEFSGALLPERFDLTEYLSDGEDHYVSIVFDTPPPEQGQIGFTSQSKYFKPRYNYSWDWCPRFVPIGIWSGLSLHTDLDAEFDVIKAWSDLEEDLETGFVGVTTMYDPVCEAEDLQVQIRVSDGQVDIATEQFALPTGRHEVMMHVDGVEPWWPNGAGPQRTYVLAVEVVDGDDNVQWRHERKIGFKCVRWLRCEGAPEDALPWICEVNGERIFLQGVNWSPIHVNYLDTVRDEYKRRIDLYKDMGCNIFRVWGGAYLESEDFYQLCDEAGIMVWQEFPLSSSGIDNAPPSDPQVIEELTHIAQSYIERRLHHASLLMWCGGNELQSADGTRPASPDHPCLAALADVVRAHDPVHRYLHTSASGPRFHADPSEYGKGVHHEVHGPWGFDGDMEAFEEYFSGDDSLFRAEVGVPGACDVEFIKRYYPDGQWWPPNNDAWTHSCSWWTSWERYKHLDELEPEQALQKYVQQTQQEQREGYKVAAGACKRRFPECGGFIIWHGHDCYPCAINNSAIDFEGRPKAGFEGLKQVFTRSPEELREE